MSGKFSQPLPFIVNQTPQPLAKGSRNNERPLNARIMPELRLFYIAAATRILTSSSNQYLIVCRGIKDSEISFFCLSILHTRNLIRIIQEDKKIRRSLEKIVRMKDKKTYTKLVV